VAYSTEGIYYYTTNITYYYNNYYNNCTTTYYNNCTTTYYNNCTTTYYSKYNNNNPYVPCDRGCVRLERAVVTMCRHSDGCTRQQFTKSFRICFFAYVIIIYA
jgi:hypothetical protein